MKRLILTVLNLLLIQSYAHASSTSTGLPWEGVLQKISASLNGPVFDYVAIIALIAAAISLAFFEVGKAMRWIVAILIAFAIGKSAISLLALFGGSSALI